MGSTIREWQHTPFADPAGGTVDRYALKKVIDAFGQKVIAVVIQAFGQDSEPCGWHGFLEVSGLDDNGVAQRHMFHATDLTDAESVSLEDAKTSVAAELDKYLRCADEKWLLQSVAREKQAAERAGSQEDG